MSDQSMGPERAAVIGGCTASMVLRQQLNGFISGQEEAP